MGRSSVKRRQQKTASVSALRGFLWTFTPVICEWAGLMLAVTAQSLHQSTIHGKEPPSSDGSLSENEVLSTMSQDAQYLEHVSTGGTSSPRCSIARLVSALIVEKKN